MNIFCKYGIHKLKIWYEDNWETCKVCTRCGEEQSISSIPAPGYKRPDKTLKDKRKKKLARIKMHELLSRKKL